MNHYSTQSHTRGFSLIEVAIVIGVVALISIGAARLGRDTFVFTGIFNQELNVISEGRKILRPMVSEIRSASLANSGSYTIESAEDNSFIFYSDIDNDNLKERVRYFLEDGEFKKGVVTPTLNPVAYDLNTEEINTIIKNVVNTDPVFSYYDTDYDGSSDPLEQPIFFPDIRLVRVDVTIDADSSRPPEAVTLTTQVSLRNLKDNL